MSARKQFTLLFITVFIASFLSLLSGFGLLGFLEDEGLADEERYTGYSAYDFSGCTVAAIDIVDYIDTYDRDCGPDEECYSVTSSEEVVDILTAASEEPEITGMLLQIDSLGGSPQAAHEMAVAVRAAGKPSVAWIRGYGLSAGYWVASAADIVVAAPTSEVGSIGVTQSYVDRVEQNATDGLTFNSLSTGPFKDTGSPDKPLSEDERAYLARGLQDMLDIFIDAVSANRDLPREDVVALADGSSFLGSAALDSGLIDRLGTKPEALAALEKAMDNEAVLCWPQYDGEES